jgi:hypothetical protein
VRGVLIPEGNILTGDESVRIETIACFVVIETFFVVIKDPGRPAGTARLVNKPANLVSFLVPEAPYAALITKHSPALEIDPALRVERSDYLVSTGHRALRVLL